MQPGEKSGLVYDRRMVKTRAKSTHAAYQRRYFSRPEDKPRMRPGSSRYTLRHLEAVLAALDPKPGMRILEIGCGMGRFSLLLAERGCEVTAVDLSPDLLAEFAKHDPDGSVQTVCCDAAELDRHVEGPFDAAVGFFFLHHLADIEPVLRAAAGVLRPGAKVAFCEPNAYNPLFYLQILVTPGMTWRGDGGIVRMRPGFFTSAFARSGLTRPRLRRYGIFPPLIANTTLGGRVEAAIEKISPLGPLFAFQVVSGVRQS
jgi:2-polyprenyl-3-methyl-5-hydroxy-6-metoxy-1,4-benzoquinol methylase